MQPAAPHDAEALARSLAEKGVLYVTGSFLDVLGRAKGKMVPVHHLPGLLRGSERYTPRGLGDLGQMTPEEDEVVALPDPSTLRILPWDRRFAWMAADMLFGGREPWALCPRSILKRQLARAADRGLTFQLGVELELFVFKESSLTRRDGYLEPMARSGGLKPTPAYDVDATLDAAAFLDPMVRWLNECDFGVFSFDQEGGDGQYEIDFRHAPALETADKMTLFRLAARQAAKQAGLCATFMPKPYTGSWGSGAHFNMSLCDAGTGANLMPDANDPRGVGWSRLTYQFVAGLLKHARSLAAVTTPTVNSFKRLTPRLADGSVSWAPVYAAYGDNNRSCMVRLPRNRPCVEDRAVDAAANTYLAAAFVLAAGLEGIELGLDPGHPVGERAYDPVSAKAVRLPRTLLEAIDAFEEDPLTHQVFPGRFVTEYVRMKRNEWDEYHSQVTDWERERYLFNL
jgi:glutamine synthetase